MSSDLVVSLLLKPVGSAVHMRRGTVKKGLVRWLVLGSVPCAFAGVLALRALGDGERVQSVIKLMLGIALLMASSAIVVKAYMQMRATAADRAVRAAHHERAAVGPLRVRPLPTLLIGALGGFTVGMTSVGSGSLIIVLLLLLYPTIKASEVVGTDLVQAVPLVGAAALGHLLFGEVEFGLTASLVLGGIPGVYFGARLSSRAPQGIIRRALVLVLVASGLKLVGASNTLAACLLIALVAFGPILWAWARHRSGLPWLWSVEKRQPTSQALFFESLAQEEADRAGPAAVRSRAIPRSEERQMRRSGGGGS